jgi:hypothetical protein
MIQLLDLPPEVDTERAPEDGHNDHGRYCEKYLVNLGQVARG